MKSEAQQECWHSQSSLQAACIIITYCQTLGLLALQSQEHAFVSLLPHCMHGVKSHSLQWSRLIIIDEKWLKSHSHVSPGKDSPGDVNEGGKNHFRGNSPKFSGVLMVCFPLASHRNPRQQEQLCGCVSGTTACVWVSPHLCDRPQPCVSVTTECPQPCVSVTTIVWVSPALRVTTPECPQPWVSPHLCECHHTWVSPALCECPHTPVWVWLPTHTPCSCTAPAALTRVSTAMGPHSGHGHCSEHSIFSRGLSWPSSFLPKGSPASCLGECHQCRHREMCCRRF